MHLQWFSHAESSCCQMKRIWNIYLLSSAPGPLAPLSLEQILFRLNAAWFRSNVAWKATAAYEQ